GRRDRARSSSAARGGCRRRRAGGGGRRHYLIAQDRGRKEVPGITVQPKGGWSVEGNGQQPPRTSVPAPVVETPLRYGAEARVVRLRLPQGSVIRKEPIGPGRTQRLRQERTALEALAGVPGIVHLSPALSQPPRSEE